MIKPAGKGIAKGIVKPTGMIGVAKPAGIMKPAGVMKPAGIAKVGKGQGGKDAVDVPDDISRTVSVKNIGWKVEFKQLKEHMAQCGSVEFAGVFSNVWEGSKGSGWARYATDAEAATAVATMNGTTLGGREIVVAAWTGNRPKHGSSGSSHQQSSWGMDPYSMMMMGMGGGWGKGGGKGGGKNLQVKGPPEQMVYVGNLPQGIDWKQLKEHMSQAGTVEFGKECGKWGQVRFATAEEAQQAIASLNGSVLNGQEIQVDVWTTGKKE